MTTPKKFAVAIRKRDGTVAQFGANETHDTRAKRRAGIPRGGYPTNVGSPAELRPERPVRAWPVVTSVLSFTALGLGWVHLVWGWLGVALALGVLVVIYRCVRWTLRELVQLVTWWRRLWGRAPLVAEVAAPAEVLPTIGEKVNLPGRQ